MNNNRINPEKITHPFQLMAAWFVMLIVLVGILLAAASKIQSPPWITPFLVISTVALTLIVMVAVFLMLTIFRPHLQGPKEYAEWVKDERRFRTRNLQSISTIDRYQADCGEETIAVSSQFQVRETVNSEYLASLSRLPRANEVVKSLKEIGFATEVFDKCSHTDGAPENHESIWIGSRIPASAAIQSIKNVVKIWPHLKYLHLSTDGDEIPPDRIHNQIYFGGASRTARAYGLKPWTVDEIEKLQDELSQQQFHKLIREKYSD
jgi:hypothetical protein